MQKPQDGFPQNWVEGFGTGRENPLNLGVNLDQEADPRTVCHFLSSISHRMYSIYVDGQHMHAHNVCSHMQQSL